ncbi:hypothetical protein Tco_1254126 [Tanacetum coccineum]
MYMLFSQMLKSFDTQDLEDLYKLVKAKYGSTRPVEDLDLILYGDLKTMFDPHVEDIVWRNQQDYRVLDWKIYDSCGVHSLRMQHVYIHMLVEKRYPPTPATITDVLNKKLQCDHFSKMGRIVGFKRLLYDLRVTAAQVYVTAAKLNVGIKSLLEVTAAKVRVSAAKQNLVLFEVVYTTSLRMVSEVFCKREKNSCDFSHAPPNEYSPSPNDKKQWSLGEAVADLENCDKKVSMKKAFQDMLIQKLRQKGVYEESFSRHAA